MPSYSILWKIVRPRLILTPFALLVRNKIQFIENSCKELAVKGLQNQSAQKRRTARSKIGKRMDKPYFADTARPTAEIANSAGNILSILPPPHASSGNSGKSSFFSFLSLSLTYPTAILGEPLLGLMHE